MLTLIKIPKYFILFYYYHIYLSQLVWSSSARRKRVPSRWGIVCAQVGTKLSWSWTGLNSFTQNIWAQYHRRQPNPIQPKKARYKYLEIFWCTLLVKPFFGKQQFQPLHIAWLVISLYQYGICLTIESCAVICKNNGFSLSLSLSLLL